MLKNKEFLEGQTNWTKISFLREIVGNENVVVNKIAIGMNSYSFTKSMLAKVSEGYLQDVKLQSLTHIL